MRSFKTLPVYVKENHDEVLPYIYRCIGSKHLPMKDIVLLHFDSHPDLLIPGEMPANKVFNKEELFDSLSIENWILPAVYAGHFSHIVWFKPPWCSQIQDKVVECYVGKCEKTGKIRISCTESYFVSEALYVPESKLLNKQKLTLIIVSVIPENWNNLTVTSAATSEKTVIDTVKEEVHAKLDTKEGTKEVIDTELDTNKDLAGTETNTLKSLNENNNSFDTNAGAHPAKSEICTDKDTDLLEPYSKVAKLDKCKKAKVLTESEKTATHIKTEQSQPDREISNDFICSTKSSPTEDVIKMVQDILKDRYCILDIDLDFFSTKNPFKEMYGEEQYKILQKLYRFEKPKSTSEQDLEHCVTYRQKQLDDLKNVFTALEKNLAATIEHPKKDLITKLLADLQSKSPVPVDFTLLHEGGCTCDDTELPHHLSSNTQIEALVDCVQDILSHLKKPTLITAARSSIDDYCPPNQVDFIQEKVLEMLQELYLQVEVTMAYETDD